MDPFPHRYSTSATAGPEGSVALSSEGLDSLDTAPPAEFGGPGDRWSPETLLVGAVADCFVLSFRAVARASGFEWRRLRCSANGTLDRHERITRFTRIDLEAVLEIDPEPGEEAPAESRIARGRRLLEKAETACLVSRSLACDVVLDARVG